MNRGYIRRHAKKQQFEAETGSERAPWMTQSMLI